MRSNPEKLKSRRRAAILNIAARPLALLGKILFHRVGVIGGLLLLQINFYIIAFVRFRSSPYYDQFNWILVALSWLSRTVHRYTQIYMQLQTLGSLFKHLS